MIRAWPTLDYWKRNHPPFSWLDTLVVPTPPPLSSDRSRSQSRTGSSAAQQQQQMARGGTATLGTIANVPAALFASLLAGPLVEIIVGGDTGGPEARVWSLHRNLLAYHSDFFAQRFGTVHDTTAHVNGDLKGKGPALRLDLATESPRAFELLVKWLYQGAIDDVSAIHEDANGVNGINGVHAMAESAEDSGSNNSTPSLSQKKWEYAFACQQLYTLCERLGLSALKNEAIDQFRRGCYEAGLVPGPEEMVPVYQNTPAGSPFRKLVARIAARQIMDPDNNRDAGTYRKCFEVDPDFAVDLVNSMRESMGGKLLPDPTEGDNCEYHEHEDGRTCERRPRSRRSSVNGILKKKVKWQE